MAIKMEDYLRWRDNAVTQWIFAAFEKAALMQSDAWMERSWGAGTADPVELVELRTRADAYRSIFETPFEQLQLMNGEQDDS